MKVKRFHAHFVMNIHHPNHQSLKAVVAEERLRRGEDAQRRTSSLGSDYRALCHADVRSSKLLYQTTNNLSALEIQLSEDNSREQDKARIVFVKMLRERLTKESGVLVEKAKIYSRMQQQEAQSERYLQHLEEAMAVLSATKGPVEAFDGGDDASDIVTNTRDEIEANVGALVKGLVARHITELQTRMKVNSDRLELAVSTLLEMLEREHQQCVERYRDVEKQEQALQHTETQRNNADDITTDVTIMNSMHNNDFVRLRTIMTEIRRKDSALARLQHVLKGVQAHIIDKVYRSQLGALHAMLSNIDVVDEGALGGTKMELLSGGINWTEEVVSSLDTLPPLPPRSNVPIGGPSAVPESDEIDEASKVIGIQGNNERMNDGEAVLGPGCDPATPSRKTLTGMVTGSKFPVAVRKSTRTISPTKL